ncbi:MAG: 23S rRNA (guanosine(2251)-2'-O)-methyltransferase RlmB [Ectothiorhodospiraceae bacterium]|nr:23S rRNA (guanosine(2251)-2'-O)-methyltransferase RlmB [Ectothiorhodospiraceae bacterium]
MAQEERIYGVHAVRAALKYDPAHVVEAWLESGRHDQRMARVRDALRRAGVTTHLVRRRELDALTGGGVHQGVVIRYQGPPPQDQEDLEALLEGLESAPLLLVLDQVQDPHNLGACLRTADGAGVHAVVVPRDRAVGLTPTVHKVASGAAGRVPFFQVTNLARCLDMLKQRGVWLVGADGEAEQSLFELDLTGPVAVVMGAEGEGLRRLTREACDFLARIPMAGPVGSLNVSVATGILLYEAVRQRSRD